MDDRAAPVPDNFITLQWADGEYDFRLPIGNIAELQTKCDAGIGKVYARLMAGRYINREGQIVLNPMQAEFRYEDIAEVIRLALIGGGKGIVDGNPVEVGPAKAVELVKNYVHTRPLLENWRVASAVLSAFLIGYDDPDKEAEKKSQEGPTQPTKDGSTSTAH